MICFFVLWVMSAFSSVSLFVCQLFRLPPVVLLPCLILQNHHREALHIWKVQTCYPPGAPDLPSHVACLEYEGARAPTLSTKFKG